MFQIAFRSAVNQLEQLRLSGQLDSFAVIGGFAVARWGRPRATGDIDFAVRPSQTPIERLASMLGGVYRRGEITDPLLGSISFQIATGAGEVPVQLLHFPTAWEKITFHNLQRIELEHQSIPIVDWKALVLLKLYAGGALDLEDARGVLELASPKKKDRDYLEQKAKLLRISRRLKRVQNWE